MGAFHHNPLISGSAAAWDELIAATDPASLLVIIEARMGPRLRSLHTPEDVFQEALLHAWRDRTRCEWRGVKAFRSWLLTIIDHRIADLAEAAAAKKRGGATPVATMPQISTAGDTGPAGPIDSTTPSKIAIYREQAAAVREALLRLPPELAAVLQLRLLEQLTCEEVAAKLGIGESAVRHRFRKAALLYRRCLTQALRSRTRAEQTRLEENATRSTSVSATELE
ncbi:MAG: RNA polymerase sigma factor [Phycisphaerae bacterium]|nr:RNA polymerase sigma factor [Phycisphaerae bacterium]